MSTSSWKHTPHGRRPGWRNGWEGIPRMRCELSSDTCAVASPPSGRPAPTSARSVTCPSPPFGGPPKPSGDGNAMDRTVRLQILATPDQATTLAETVSQSTAVFNAICAYGWEHHIKNGVTLHHRIYRPLKAQYPA